MPSFTPWQASNQYPAGDAPFRAAETHGPAPRGHDYLDNLRMYWRRTPEATYPDGYLGTIQSRRGDRLLDGLKARTQNRPNTRGIHKGERIDRRDYFWPDEFGLDTGLQLQSQAQFVPEEGWTCPRYSPPGLGEWLPDERYRTDLRVGPRGVPVGSRYANTNRGPGVPPSPDRIPTLRAQAPPYASGIRGNPGMSVPYPGR